MSREVATQSLMAGRTLEDLEQESEGMIRMSETQQSSSAVIGQRTLAIALFFAYMLDWNGSERANPTIMVCGLISFSTGLFL